MAQSNWYVGHEPDPWDVGEGDVIERSSDDRREVLWAGFWPPKEGAAPVFMVCYRQSPSGFVGMANSDEWAEWCSGSKVARTGAHHA